MQSTNTLCYRETVKTFGPSNCLFVFLTPITLHGATPKI